MCFHTCLVSVLFTGPSLLVVNKTKSKFSRSIFATVRRINETLGVYFTLEFSSIGVLHHSAVFILELLPYLKYRTPF